MTKLSRDLRDAIRTIPDYPKPGIMFRDVTPLFGDAQGLQGLPSTQLVRTLPHRPKVDAVAGIEARGFIMGGAMARSSSRLRVHSDP